MCIYITYTYIYVRIVCNALLGEYGHWAYVILDHKTSRKSLGYICSNSILWVKIIDFSFMPKIIRILKD